MATVSHAASPRIAVLVTVLVLFAADTGWCQSPADYESRLSHLESRVRALGQHQSSAHSNSVTSEGVYAGFSFVFAKLQYHESFRAMVTDLGTGTLNLVPFGNDFEITPRVWMGYKSSSGLGIRATWWGFDHNDDGLRLVNDGVNVPSATAVSVIFPASITTALPGDALTVSTGLKAGTIDLEGTYDARVRRADVVLGGGIRYAHAEQNFNGVVTTGAPIPGVTPASLTWLRDFEAIGPTISAQGRVPIGSSGFYGTGGVRVSFLFGNKTLTRTVVNDATPLPNTGPPRLVLEDADEITGTYAVNVGAGWKKSTRAGDVFIEGGYEGQLWTAGGAPTLTFLGFNGLNLSFGISR